MKVPALPIVASGVIGIACGIISNTPLLTGTWLNVVFWGLVGTGMGAFLKEKKDAVPAGLTYGVVLTLSFLISGFRGARDQVFPFILFSIGLSVIGAGCGLLAVWAGYQLRKLFRIS